MITLRHLTLVLLDTVDTDEPCPACAQPVTRVHFSIEGGVQTRLYDVDVCRHCEEPA